MLNQVSVEAASSSPQGHISEPMAERGANMTDRVSRVWSVVQLVIDRRWDRTSQVMALASSRQLGKGLCRVWLYFTLCFIGAIWRLLSMAALRRTILCHTLHGGR
jgi:hypothetical protein